jgi:hypothetical protein
MRAVWGGAALVGQNRAPHITKGKPPKHVGRGSTESERFGTATPQLSSLKEMKLRVIAVR